MFNTKNDNSMKNNQIEPQNINLQENQKNAQSEPNDKEKMMLELIMQTNKNVALLGKQMQEFHTKVIDRLENLEAKNRLLEIKFMNLQNN